MQPEGRIWQLDEVRALLVFGVIAFHAVRVYDPFEFYVKSEHQLAAAGLLVLFVRLWGMPLFFALAGYAMRFSLTARSTRAFVVERIQRLGVPFALGIALLVPPQIYAMRNRIGEPAGVAETFDQFFEMHWSWELPLPLEGRWFEPAHLWFLVYLLVFSLLLLPVFRLLEQPAAARRLAERARRGVGVGGLAVVGGLLAVIEAGLGSESAGGWNRLSYPVLIVVGWLIAAHPELLRGTERRRRLLGSAEWVIRASSRERWAALRRRRRGPQRELCSSRRWLEGIEGGDSRPIARRHRRPPALTDPAASRSGAAS